VTLGVRRVEFEFGDFDEFTGVRLAPPTRKAANSPALGVLYKLSPGWAVYGNYAEALEQGSTAPSNASVDNPGQVLPPQTSKQREAGVKCDAGRFGVTAALFQIERANAVTVNRQFGYFGLQENKGLELSVFGEPAAGWRLLSGVTYLRTRQRNTQVAATEGKSAIGVPGLRYTTRVADRAVQLRLNVENLADKDYWGSVDRGFLYSGQPRTVSFSASVDF
jgi:iron complex outermembrane recepter protein